MRSGRKSDSEGSKGSWLFPARDPHLSLPVPLMGQVLGRTPGRGHPEGTGVGGGVFRVCSQGFFREDNNLDLGICLSINFYWNNHTCVLSVVPFT